MRIYLILLILSHINFSSAARILALFPYPLKSHFIVFEALLIELANRGHDLTVVTSFPKNHNISNYHEIDTSFCLQIPSQIFEIDYAISNYKSGFHLVSQLSIVNELHEELLKCDPVQKLFKIKKSYDLLITEAFVCDALLPFAYKLQVPYILFSSLPILPWHSDRIGNIDNPSYITFPFSDYLITKNSPFWVRLYNTAIYLASRGYHKLQWEPYTNEMVKKYFGPSIPSVQEIALNTSLILSFSHFSINSPRPLVPTVIEAGGLHIRNPAPLPKDIENFINNSAQGVIYFCLGSLLRANTMPEHIRNAFLTAFKRIPQRVLWKWENEELLGKSDNIMIKKWMPQRDILAHHNTKLFIAHGGSLGLNEAVYEGVPVLGIPFYGDQKINLLTIQDAGAGEILSFDEINAEIIYNKLNKILKNPSYQQNAKRLSAMYKDRPKTPMENAVYWTEYVIRHKGASHLRPASKDLYWYQYLLLDVIAFISIVILFIFYLLKKTLSLILSICLRRSLRKQKIN